LKKIIIKWTRNFNSLKIIKSGRRRRDITNTKALEIGSESLPS